MLVPFASGTRRAWLGAAARQRRPLGSKIGRRSLSRTTVPVKPIPEVHLPGPYSDKKFSRALQPFHEKEHPVIIREGALHYKLVKRWTLEYFKTKFGKFPIDVEAGPYNRGEIREIPFERYADYLEKFDKTKDEILYMSQNAMPSPISKETKYPAVCDDETGELVGEGTLYNENLWIGPEGCHKPLHHDPLDVFIIQVEGTKKVTMIDKKVDHDLLYVEEFIQTSLVDVENIDYDRFPRFQEVPEMLTAELRRGDILYIPTEWWHDVRYLSYCSSLNIFWK